MSAILKDNVFELPVQSKKCSDCGEVKPFSEFHKQRNGLRRNCKPCRHIEYRNARGNDPDGRKKIVLTENGRVCVTCEQPKEWDQFAKDIHGYNQKTATCIPCRNSKAREQYKNNPAVRRTGGMKNRPDKLMRLYGLTFADVVRVFDEQHGRCANHACGKEISLEIGQGHNRAMIDHNHKTGKFRALLCCACNFTLGYLEKQESIILGLQDYLTKHNKGS